METYTYTYKGSYGVGKGQHHVTGTVTIHPTRDPDRTAKDAALADMRHRFPTSARKRHIHVTEVTPIGVEVIDPASPRGQAIIADSAHEQPVTLGDPPPVESLGDSKP